MLEYAFKESVWFPPELNIDAINEQLDRIRSISYREYLLFLQETPYIDAVYLIMNEGEKLSMTDCIRFVFHEDYVWDRKSEKLFIDKCLNNPNCYFDRGAMERIFRFYSSSHPDWKLKRYFTAKLRMLDHIYACLKKNTVKEMLYKAGLDELAVVSDSIDEYDLLSTKPSDIYDGISLRTLRALNCVEGAKLLAYSYNRMFIKKLQSSYPDIFNSGMNDSQCKYLGRLIEGELTVGEAGRLYNARKRDLAKAWAPTQYNLIVERERQQMSYEHVKKMFAGIDNIYIKLLMNNINQYSLNMKEINKIKYYLFDAKDEYDRKVRASNRKRDYTWQERDHGYVIRYPQTINDFCREAVYQSNCLLAYVEALIHNDTTILFMRKENDVNKPFITIEIFKNRLAQAYHRFNEDCTPEEASWIREYCSRHGLDTGEFKFNNIEDRLM